MFAFIFFAFRCAQQYRPPMAQNTRIIKVKNNVFALSIVAKAPLFLFYCEPAWSIASDS